MLLRLAELDIERLFEPLSLFSSENDILIENIIESLHNSSIQAVGTGLDFRKIFDYFGFNKIDEELFMYLVISQLAFLQS